MVIEFLIPSIFPVYVSFIEGFTEVTDRRNEQIIIRRRLAGTSPRLSYELRQPMRCSDWKSWLQLTGSLANYNYSDHSDLDVHILLDFADINEDESIVKRALRKKIYMEFETRYKI